MNYLNKDEAFQSGMNALCSKINHLEKDLQDSIKNLYARDAMAYLILKEELSSLDHKHFIKLTEAKKKMANPAIYSVIKKPYAYSALEQLMSAEYREILKVVKHERTFFVSREIIDATDFYTLNQLMLDYFVFLNDDRLRQMLERLPTEK